MGDRGARQDGVAIGVAGLDEFDIDDFSGELEDAKKPAQLGIRSPTLKKQVFKSGAEVSERRAA